MDSRPVFPVREVLGRFFQKGAFFLDLPAPPRRVIRSRNGSPRVLTLQPQPSPAQRSAAAALGLYILISLACFVRTADLTHYFLGSSCDALLFIWCLNWWPFALAHGLNPFITHYVWFPGGYNLTWATSLAVPALLSWPVTALGGPVLSYNILMLLAPALAAWSCALLARELGCAWPAAFIGGLLFGFSGPELNQVSAEINLSSVYYVPLAVLLCVRHVRGRIRQHGFILALAVLLCAQLGTSTEMLASLCLTGALSWTCFLILVPAARGALRRLARDIALAAPVTMLLAAPFLYYLLRGAADFPAYIHPWYYQQDDLLQFIFPVLPLRGFVPALASIAAQLRGFGLESYSFTSIPALVILIWYFAKESWRPYARGLLAVICLTALLTLGLSLEFDGTRTSFPLPWALLAHIPFIRSILPLRFLVYFTLGSGIAAALFLNAARSLPQRAARYGLAALALGFLPPAHVNVFPAPWQTLPLLAVQTSFKWLRWPEQPFFTKAHIRAALGPHPNVLLLPDPVIGPGMAWQVDAGMSFTQAEGYIGYTLAPERKWDIPDKLTWNRWDDFAREFPAFCAAHQVDYVLIGQGAPSGLTQKIEALGWPRHIDDGIEVIKTPYARAPGLPRAAASTAAAAAAR